ncbi:MAG: Holliday junction resolvase RuvX [Candidatus Hodgkinia cicadicola]
MAIPLPLLTSHPTVMSLTKLRFLCLDGGSMIGIAKASIMPTPCGSQFVTSLVKQLSRLRFANPTVCVITYPLSVAGKQNDATRKARALASMIRSKVHLPVILRDERFTSKWGSLTGCHSHSASLVLHSLSNPIS